MEYADRAPAHAQPPSLLRLRSPTGAGPIAATVLVSMAGATDHDLTMQKSEAP